MIRSFWYLKCYFKHISHIVLVFPVLLWESKCQLVCKFVFKVYDKDSRTTTENFLLFLSLTLSRYFCTMKRLFLKCSLVCVRYGGGVHLRQMKLKRKILIRHCIKIPSCLHYTAQKMKFSIKDFVSKCDQIRRKQRLWSHLLKKPLMENFIFCAVLLYWINYPCVRIAY